VPKQNATKTCGGLEIKLHAFLTAEIDLDELSVSSCGRFALVVRAVFICYIGGCVEGGAWLWRRKESLLLPEIYHWSVQPVLTELSRPLQIAADSQFVKRMSRAAGQL